jgi:hypothetical protein
MRPNRSHRGKEKVKLTREEWIRAQAALAAASSMPNNAMNVESILKRADKIVEYIKGEAK